MTLMARYNVEGDGDKLAAAVEHAVEQAAEFEQHVAEAEAARARRARRRRPTPAPPMTKPAAGPTGCRRKSAH